MSDYSKTTNFTAKDSLASGDPNKVIKGSEHDTEYDNIATAVATKANKVSSPTTNNLAMLTATGDIADSSVESDGSGNITANVTGNLTGNADTATTATTAANLSGTNLTGDVTNSGNTISLAANTVASSEIDFTIGTATSASPSGTTWTVPAGLVNIVRTAGGSPVLELFVGGAWRTDASGFSGGCVWSDGTNMRLSAGAYTVYYQILA